MPRLSPTEFAIAAEAFLRKSYSDPQVLPFGRMNAQLAAGLLDLAVDVLRANRDRFDEIISYCDSDISQEVAELVEERMIDKDVANEER